MARRPTTSPPPHPAKLSSDQMKRGIVALKRRVSDLEIFDPQKIPTRVHPDVTALEKSIEETLSNVFGHDTIDYNRYRDAANLDDGPWLLNTGFGAQQIVPHRDYLRDGKAKSLALLKAAIRGLEERISDQDEDQAESLASNLEVSKPASSICSKVFVVHGHDAAAREAVARFLEKIELEAIILHEQPDQGMTIIEKFETHASQVGFAVVLMTPDDLGASSKTKEQSSRARQNVIFELGYFVGRLGRGRACLIRKGDVEIPSDLHGVIYTDMDAGEGWKFKLAKELKAAGMDVDMNKAI